MYYNIESRKTATVNEIRKENSNKSFPKVLSLDILSNLGYVEIARISPELKDFENMVNGELKIIDDIPTITNIAELKSSNEISKLIKAKTQELLDDKAQELGYDDINSIGKYIGYYNDYAFEAEKLGMWASSVWKYVETELVKISSGDRELPASLEEIISELPEYEG